MDLNIIRNEIIGNDTFFQTPYGRRLITYADYTASGRTLSFIEKYLIEIQKVYANTHTVDSYTGKTMTGLLHKAEEKIKTYVNANEENYIISVGTGTTGAIAKLCEILGLYLTPLLKYNIDKLVKEEDRYIIEDIFKQMNERKPVIFVSPYEHHSNYLIWKESFAEVVEVELNDLGEIDINDLTSKLSQFKDRIIIGSFSAASNITGIKTKVYEIAKIFHEHNGLIFFDFAACAPYVEINMNKDDISYFDGIFFSPHKFIGGPGSSGILVINKRIYNKMLPPTVSGGGTVDFVSSYCYEYSKDVETREKAGTPGILQILKSALTIELKHIIGIDKIEQIEHKMLRTVFQKLNHKNILLLGPVDTSKRINIVSFNIKHQDKLLHHKFVSTLLNDLFGIQSRAGCACAGPYGHRLLGIKKDISCKLQTFIDKGLFSFKQGFVRVNFHYLMTEDEINFICNAIRFIADFRYLFLSQYYIDIKTGVWKHRFHKGIDLINEQFGVIQSLQMQDTDVFKKININRKQIYSDYLSEANNLLPSLQEIEILYKKFKNREYELFRWFHFMYIK